MQEPDRLNDRRKIRRILREKRRATEKQCEHMMHKKAAEAAACPIKLT